MYQARARPPMYRATVSGGYPEAGKHGSPAAADAGWRAAAVRFTHPAREQIKQTIPPVVVGPTRFFSSLLLGGPRATMERSHWWISVMGRSF